MFYYKNQVKTLSMYIFYHHKVMTLELHLKLLSPKLQHIIFIAVTNHMTQGCYFFYLSMVLSLYLSKAIWGLYWDIKAYWFIINRILLYQVTFKDAKKKYKRDVNIKKGIKCGSWPNCKFPIVQSSNNVHQSIYYDFAVASAQNMHSNSISPCLC